MAAFPTNGWNLPGEANYNTPSPFDLLDGNDAIKFTPTLADIKANATTFAPRARRPFALRRYISERKAPLGYRRPLSPSVARKRMLAKLQEFDDRFNSSQDYDQWWETIRRPAVPYDHAGVLDVVAPWMYPYHEDEHLSKMMAGAWI
ncbi:hypothetical protein BBK36DRAFT_1161701 [Trichoderma citrinoviride]|uniref:Uncharacterized protein n=1 Tax=Trichoderma citrinoviride TaxID=58853 RepID=A0A2T4B351_9HYPO|nr:hypothetical protein BBK36DRAFT_1161701 [Trichoderma citrinoviride]PTB63755.1 hypothetical protein BBK36DRAFT_1161701 [Trichoderma citrinoviride]